MEKIVDKARLITDMMLKMQSKIKDSNLRAIKCEQEEKPETRKRSIHSDFMEGSKLKPFDGLGALSSLGAID